MTVANDAALLEIRNYLVDILGPVQGPGGVLPVPAFLDRLIDEMDGNIVKGPLETKAGRQLLCSIGIDIKHGIVPVDHYRSLFGHIRMDEMELEARKLFRAAVLDKQLFYRIAEERQVKEFSIVVFALKDLHYYYNGLGITGGTEVSIVRKKVSDHRSKGIPLEVCQHTFNKNRGENQSRYFWVTTPRNIEEMIRSVEPPRVTTQVIDQMGLSHFDLDDEDQQDFFYIDFHEAEFTTFKPNATLVDWDSPLTGFLSCWRRQPEGHTFSITGYKNFREGVSERMFLKALLSPEQQRKALIKLFERPVIPPIQIETNDLIAEGIKRFNA